MMVIDGLVYVAKSNWSSTNLSFFIYEYILNYMYIYRNLNNIYYTVYYLHVKYTLNCESRKGLESPLRSPVTALDGKNRCFLEDILG